MVELEKRISGDWIDLKEVFNDLSRMLELLAMPSAELKAAGERLRLCLEQGIIEYKRLTVSPVLSVLETTRYKSLSTEEIAEQERSLTALLLVVLVERLIVLGHLPPSRAPEEKRTFSVDEMEVNVILSDINSRVKTNPDLRAHTAVKNILMQVQIYKKEQQKLKELLPTIKPEMKPGFLANFSNAFSRIVSSIRKNYQSLLQEELDAEKARQESFSLSMVSLKDLAPLLTSQVREFCRIRSTLAHAREDKYKTREVLVGLYDGRQEAMRLIEDEVEGFRRLCGQTARVAQDSCVSGLADALRAEVVAALEKQVKRDGADGS